MMLMLSKLSSKTQYTARSHEVGKIINMFSNDFNIVEFKTPWFFLSSVTPITLIGSAIILILRLGWPGILCPIIVLLFLPLQLWISKTNGDGMKRINVDKDRRVKLTSEIIEGIKFIKLYGWELAFQDMVRQIRSSEIHQYIKLSVGKSFERALAHTTVLWSGFVCFLVMYFTGEGELLNVANIFSTLEILMTLKISLFYAGFSGGFYF